LRAVSQWISNAHDLNIKNTYPHQVTRQWINTLVNGFKIEIDRVTVVFIPSDATDLEGFEIPREWVDLPNWAADYYVPIQAISEDNFIHLWGIISHREIKSVAKLDPNFQTYEVDSSDLTQELDILWNICELSGQNRFDRPTLKITPIPPMEIDAARIAIAKLQCQDTSFSPRLELSFQTWGAILDTPEYLAIYRSSSNPNRLTQWMSDVGVNLNLGWQTISSFLNPPRLVGYMNADRIDFNIAPDPLNTQAQIDVAIGTMFERANLKLPQKIASSALLLSYFIKNTTDESLRWKAAEYLWAIEPDADRYLPRRIKDLGIDIEGYQLGLMVSTIELANGRHAILNRVYPIGTEKFIPANVTLSLQSAMGAELYRVESARTANDCIQLYFTATIGDVFNIRVSMLDTVILETFIV
jgi:hypothetical protein